MLLITFKVFIKHLLPHLIDLKNKEVKPKQTTLNISWVSIPNKNLLDIKHFKWSTECHQVFHNNLKDIYTRIFWMNWDLLYEYIRLEILN